MKKILFITLMLSSLISLGQPALDDMRPIGLVGRNYFFHEGLMIPDTLLVKGLVWLSGTTAVGGATDSLISIDPVTGILEKRPQSAAGASEWELTGNAGTTAGTNFIGTTDSIDFVTKTKGLEIIRTTALGLTGIGTISPLAKLNVKSGTPTESNFTLSAPDINTNATTQNGDFNNTTDSLTVELTTARGYPNINDALFVPRYIRIGTEILKAVVETPFAFITFKRGQAGTTAVAHANGEAIFYAFPYAFHHDPPNGLGISGSGGRFVFGNNEASADLTVYETGVSNIFDVNSTKLNFFRVDGVGRIGIGLGLIANNITSGSFFQVGAAAVAGTDMRFDNTARLLFTNAGGGGIIEHNGGLFIQPKGSLSIGGMILDVATNNFSENLTIFGGLQDASGYGTIIGNRIGAAYARIFSIKGKASDTATTYLFLNADTAGLLVNELYRSPGGYVRVQGFQGAGDIGEEINSTISTYANYSTTATYQNVTSIALTAGDWDISAFMTYSSNSATITAASNAIFVISTTTASAAGSTEGKNIAYIPQAALLGTSLFSESISPYRVSIGSTTTYYLNTQATFTLGNPQYAGSIRAVRMK